MTKCPKCGSDRISKRFHGETKDSTLRRCAVFSCAGPDSEHLFYSCLVCGYAECGPCKDAKKGKVKRG